MRTVLREHPLLALLLVVAAGGAAALLLRFATTQAPDGIPDRLRRTRPTTFHQPPVHVGDVDLRGTAGDLRPFALALSGDRLYVSYIGSPRVDIFDTSFHLVRSVELQTGPGTMIGGIALRGDAMFAADYGRREIGVYGMDGRRRTHFAWLPGGHTRMRPYGLALRDRVLFTADPGLGRVHAIGLAAADSAAADGELLFSMPASDTGAAALVFPSSVLVTPDGRLLVSDPASARVQVYSCSGRYAYAFEAPDPPLRAPHAIAMDDLADPEKLRRDRAIFDPSAVLLEGRVHVVDREARCVVVFDALGAPLLRYGTGDLTVPNGIAIDHAHRAIIIADSQRQCLAVYKY